MLLLVSVLVLNRLDDYFTSQQVADLQIRNDTVGEYVTGLANTYAGAEPVVGADGTLNAAVAAELATESQRRAHRGPSRAGGRHPRIRAHRRQSAAIVRAVDERSDRHAVADHTARTARPARTPRITIPTDPAASSPQYGLRVTLANPYTFRATAIANVAAVLGAIALLALGLSVVVSAGLAQRFTTPLRRLTEASRGMAAGDLTMRVPTTEARAGSTEMAELAVAFNAMADRVQESVEIIGRDRDRSRDFLADVSHELRTPLAALRTFNELLKDRAGSDPAARTEFLDSSGQQIERLDWLAQNLLELSKLDSGLVLLDLRPDDLRASVESAVEQHDAAARKRGITVTTHLPDVPVRIRHDPPRIGQVVGNLIGNAIKFTPPGGSVTVDLVGDRGRCPDRGRRHGRRDRSDRTPAHLRAVLSRLALERGTRQRERAGARDRPLDRRDARRPGRGRESHRAGIAVHGHTAAGSAPHRRDARGGTGRRRFGGPGLACET